ncbi:MAG TPA: PD-(D/E)XK nuclease family protein, partial [Candidatus Sulfotelmatobacter sp.]|nr:PD-(D/E)XK nuclease family protein [Candidatus Sulfotelmatobacter sp.]
HTEQVTELGNLDIVIWSPLARTRLIIENKVGAKDQESQLRRYRTTLESAKSQYDHRCLVAVSKVSES